MTNYVKKFIVLISIIGLIVSLFSFNVLIEVDAATGMEYDIVYCFTVIILYHQVCLVSSIFISKENTE